MHSNLVVLIKAIYYEEINVAGAVKCKIGDTLKNAVRSMREVTNLCGSFVIHNDQLNRRRKQKSNASM